METLFLVTVFFLVTAFFLVTVFFLDTGFFLETVFFLDESTFLCLMELSWRIGANDLAYSSALRLESNISRIGLG